MTFLTDLEQTQQKNSSVFCIGLDPLPDEISKSIPKGDGQIFEFNKAIIDATADLVCAYKPQIAHYSALGLENELASTISYIQDEHGIPVILDAKRGDIGSTAERYAEEAFVRYGADAVTVNPLLGLDSLAPFLAYKDKGVLVVCRTSNPGGADLQNLRLEGGSTLYAHIAHLAAREWNYNQNLLLVVGATRPQEIARIREIVGGMTLLLPGIGTQGGNIEAVVKSATGGGMIVNSSRAVIYAGCGEGFALAARKKARALRDEINRYRS